MMTVRRVLDGDTVECVFKFDGSWYKTRVRLAGIDCPESNSVGKHKKDADECTALLTSLVLNKQVKFVTPPKGKMRDRERLIGRILVGRTDVCAQLLKQGPGTIVYNGTGTRAKDWYDPQTGARLPKPMNKP
jgi:endonuclease YncB( thermonuclease family)